MFLEGLGPSLQQRLENTEPDIIARAYERQIYLERREPLQDYSEFSVGHPVDAPTHSQAVRAAVLTVAALGFARDLAAGEVAPDTLYGMPLTNEARGWLFYATRRPDAGVDWVERYSPNQTVAVLRRGHVFLLTLPNPDKSLDLAAVHGAYNEILRLSDKPLPTVCSLTADGREEWALVRWMPRLFPAALLL